MCLSQTSYALISNLCSLGKWVGFRVLISCCDFSHFWGALSTQRKGATLVGGVYVSDSRYSVSVRLLVTNQVCNVCEVEIVLNLLIPMLVHNLLDHASVMRTTHMPNSNQYLKAFIL